MFFDSTQLIIKGEEFRVLNNQKEIKNLEKLSITCSKMTSFILKSNKIKLLSLPHNQLNHLELYCPNLEYLDIGDNNLKFIDKIYAPKLNLLFCDKNLLFTKECNVYKLALEKNLSPKLIQQSSLNKALF